MTLLTNQWHTSGRLAVGVFLVLSLLILSACKQESGRTFEASGPKTYRASVVTVQSRDVPRIFWSPGMVKPVRTVQITSKITGFIQRLNVAEGDLVKRDALLVEIDQTRIREDIDVAKAVLASARLTLADAEQDVKRYRTLKEHHVASKERWSKSVLRRDVAKEEVRKARAVLAARKKDLTYTRLVAPGKGYIIQKFQNVGDMAMLGTPILLWESEALEFEAHIPGSVVNQLKPGQNGEIRFKRPDATVMARIIAIVPSVDPVTHTVTVRFSLPANAAVLAGQFGHLSIDLDIQKVLTVPVHAITEQVGIKGCFLVDEEGRAHFRSMRLGPTWQEQWIVLTGLMGGEKVILDPPPGLRSGDQVTYE
ncbi:MAG: efflux RND transporter periplasmic adaptor subunit [SAR324 cluster bacterium]|nr:efflux RND transporter periplasmic adaptor subunit [SAR324 cluster bacterium]